MPTTRDIRGSIQVDTYLRKSVEKTFTVDAPDNTFTMHIRTQSDKTFAVDAYLKSPTVKTFTIDSYLTEFGETTVSVDAYLQKQFTESFSLDAILPTRYEFVVDSILVDRNTQQQLLILI